ncbi:MAG: heme exporter protein CcmB [Chitinophagales bacterium]|nr:heme exporter protein CcmB [Chitinophagales bacterium]
MLEQANRVKYLILKEAYLEWRNKSVLASMLLYVIGATFIVYYAFEGRIEFQSWTAIFWVIVLFSVINIVGKTFEKEVNQQYYYIRGLVSPIELILSKLFYNAFLVFFFELIVYVEMTIFFGIQIQDSSYFLLVLFLGGIGFSNLFTLFSTITARLNNIVVLPVLGFPIILPLLILVLRLTNISNIEVDFDEKMINIGAMLLLDTITFILSIILFPYLWSE